jgi:hypothetical protein
MATPVEGWDGALGRLSRPRPPRWPRTQSKRWRRLPQRRHAPRHQRRAARPTRPLARLWPLCVPPSAGSRTSSPLRASLTPLRTAALAHASARPYTATITPLADAHRASPWTYASSRPSLGGGVPSLYPLLTHPHSLTLTRPPSLARSQPRARAARRQARGCAHAQPKLAFLRDPRQRERGGRRVVPPHTSGHHLPRCGPATATAAAVAAATAAAAAPTVATAASPAQPAALATPSIAFAVTCEPASTAALPMASCSTLAAMACLLLCGSGRRAGTVLRSAAHPLCWRRPAWRHCARGLYPADPHGLWRAVGCGPHSDGSYEPRRWVDAPAPCCPPWRRCEAHARKSARTPA